MLRWVEQKKKFTEEEAKVMQNVCSMPSALSTAVSRLAQRWNSKRHYAGGNTYAVDVTCRCQAGRQARACTAAGGSCRRRSQWASGENTCRSRRVGVLHCVFIGLLVRFRYVFQT